jgi:hypothetical protein
MASGLFNLKQVNQAISQGAWSGYIAPRWVEYLVVAGGGGGAYTGGGGAGGVLTGIVTVATGASYTVTIGPGGTGGTDGGNNATQGTASVFGSISATGGGAGITNYLNSAAKNNGGSGGGGGLGNVQNGQGTAGQGNAGGLSSASNGGGGGGAGTVGLAATTYGGNGGAGIASAITGTVTTYGGGGGGGFANSINSNPGAGGVGGGGSAGASTGSAAASGGSNTGGGGGGAVYVAPTFYAGGSGGSGIVVVRYPGNVQFYTGGTVTYSNGYIVHNFTANGTLAPTTPTVVSEYQISRSLRFNSADTAILSRTPASATSRKIWTWSAWVKRGSLGTTQVFFVAGVDGSNYTNLYFSGSITDNLEIYNYTAGVTTGYYYTQSVFRDPSAWYHIVYSVDTTQATAADRIKIYVNGVAQPTTVSTSIANGVDTFINSANQHYIGRNGPGNASQYFDGYMTEVNLIDGQALTPTSFGYVNPSTGVWTPAKYVGGYGTNGFYLNFSDNSNTTAATLGADYSGNGNNWTPNNFSVTAGAGNDSLVDSPTSYGTDTGVGGTVRGNYSTLSPTYAGATGITNGNLDVTLAGGTQYGTLSLTTGKWYWEVTPTTSISGAYLGVMDSTFIKTDATWDTTTTSTYVNNGNKYGIGGAVPYGATYTTGDVIGFALDLDAGTMVFYKNGASQGVATTGMTGREWRPMLYAVSGTYACNFGQRPFVHAAPSGFKALCTQNLPTPAIGATAATQANKYFGVTLRNGGGASGGTYSTTIDMASGALVWDKPRNLNAGHYLIDSVRGISKLLIANLTSAEATDATFYTGFNNGSYTTGASDWNANVTIVDWIWAANGSGTTNTAGSITSTVSANTTSGFSIVNWTGSTSTSSQTVGHGLGVTPSVVILKDRSTVDNWFVYFSGITSVTQYLRLNTTDSVITSGSNVWGAGMTSALVGIRPGTFAGSTSDNIIMYCFAPIAGYSAFGSYTGNGSADGPFVFTGMRPAFVMIKVSSGTTDSWIVLDSTRNTYNVTNSSLFPNDSAVESTGSGGNFDFLSNGFKLRTADGGRNGSGFTYIYMAFASNPFKYSLAR